MLVMPVPLLDPLTATLLLANERIIPPCLRILDCGFDGVEMKKKKLEKNRLVRGYKTQVTERSEKKVMIV